MQGEKMEQEQLRIKGEEKENVVRKKYREKIDENVR